MMEQVYLAEVEVRVMGMLWNLVGSMLFCRMTGDLGRLARFKVNILILSQAFYLGAGVHNYNVVWLS